MVLQKNKQILLIVLGILSEIIYLSFLFVEPVRKYLDDPGITLKNPQIWPVVILFLLINVLIYAIAYRNIDNSRKTTKIITTFFIIFSLTLLIVWPISSFDVFSYIGWGRVMSEHGANPYLTPYASLTEDSLHSEINNKWLSRPTPYGPLIVIIGSLLTFVSGDNLLANLFSFKLFFAIINFLNFYIVWKTFKSNEAIFLYSWCPLFLYEFCLNGHNDVLTIFFLLLAVYYLYRSEKIIEYLGVWALLMFSVLIKYSTVFIVPIIFLIILHALKKKKEKIIFILSVILLSIIIFSVFYVPFFSRSESIFSAFRSYLFLPHSDGAKLAGLPPIAIFSTMLVYRNMDPRIIPWLFNIFRVLFIFLYGYILICLLRNFGEINKNDFITYSSIILFLFLALFTGWIYPWYFTVLTVLLIYYSASNNNKCSQIIIGTILFSFLLYIFVH